MPEAIVLCIDVSEWMRNGDYIPNRLEAQHDAVNLVCTAKLQQSASNYLATICSGGNVELLTSFTNDPGNILTALHGLKLKGNFLFSKGLSVAQLALKHRVDKALSQRIIVFVGSPIAESEEELVKLAKKLKKNNLSVDIINFGEEGENTVKLESFVNAVNNKEGSSHLVTIPPGPHILSDILLTSPIVMGADGISAGGSGGAGGFEFGVDPALDPELALALRVSMEEERQRQDAEARKTEGTTGQPTTTTTAAATSSDSNNNAMVEDDEAALLAQAMAISVASGGDSGATGGGSGSVPMDSLSEEEQIAMALQMSMGGEDTSAPMDTSSYSSSVLQPQQQHDINQVMMDPSFLNSVLGSLPGVDPNDPRIQSVLSTLAGGAPKPNDNNEEEKKKEEESKK